MKIIKFDTNEEWLEARRGRIMGTKAGKLVSKKGISLGLGVNAGEVKVINPRHRLIGFYELIAERVAIPANEENVMDRGHRLEEFALDRFATETGKKVNKELVMICRDDDENIAYSPDGFIGKTEDVEVKCLSSARHIEAFLTQEIPGEYVEQIIQGFIVNDKLKTRYLVFYDPRMPKDFFYLTIKREDMQEQIEEYLELERQVLKQVAEIEKQLTF